jgi:hypothetical protein
VRCGIGERPSVPVMSPEPALALPGRWPPEALNVGFAVKRRAPC